MLKISSAPVLESLPKPDSDVFVPFGDQKFADRLMRDGYIASLSDFRDDMTKIPNDTAVNELSRLISICTRKERNIRSELEKLCYNTVVGLFNIPEETIDFEIDLVDQIDPAMQFHIKPDTDEETEYDSVEQIDSEESEVEKRMILNILVCGIAERLSESCRKEYLSELFDIDEELPHLYSKLMKLNRYVLYTNDVRIDDRNHHQGGYVKVILGNNGTVSKIEVKAVAFPILLFETIRGLMEVVISNGLPESFTEAKAVVDKADVLCQDPWNMRMGLPLWKKVTGGKDIESRNIPSVLDRIATIPTDEFLQLFNEIVHSTKKGREEMESIIHDSERENDYNDFLDDIMTRQDDEMLILDDADSPYMTEEELLNADIWK